MGNFKKLFNWRLITLQYCSGFLPYIHMNQPWVYMCLPSWNPFPPPVPSHSSGSSQCTSPELPVSCIEPGLAIYFTYGNIHVSVLFFQIIPPSLSPRVQKSVLYICLSFTVSHTIFLNFIYMHYYTVLVFYFLTYFTVYNRLQFHPPH